MLPESERSTWNTSGTGLGGIEISMIPIALTKERAQVVDFSTPLTIDEHMVLLPYPKFENDVFGLIRPFQPLVSFYVIRIAFRTCIGSTDNMNSLIQDFF